MAVKRKRPRTQTVDGYVFRRSGVGWVPDMKATARLARKRMDAVSGVSDAVRGVATERLTPRPPHMTYEDQRMRAERLGVAAAEHEAERDAYAADLVRSEAEVERLQKALAGCEERLAAHDRQDAESRRVWAATDGRRGTAFGVACEMVEKSGHVLLADMLRRQWGGL